MEEKQYIPVFAGYTEDTKKVVLYRKNGDTTSFYIRRPTDGELLTLSPGSSLDWWADQVSANRTLTIRSPEWSGTAKGTDHITRMEPAI